MKKSLLSLLLILSLLLCVTCAAAEEWVCPDCGQTNTGNFCPNCGAKSPIWICPTCGQSNIGLYGIACLCVQVGRTPANCLITGQLYFFA